LNRRVLCIITVNIFIFVTHTHLKVVWLYVVNQAVEQSNLPLILNKITFNKPNIWSGREGAASVQSGLESPNRFTQSEQIPLPELTTFEPLIGWPFPLMTALSLSISSESSICCSSLKKETGHDALNYQEPFSNPQKVCNLYKNTNSVLGG